MIFYSKNFWSEYVNGGYFRLFQDCNFEKISARAILRQGGMGPNPRYQLPGPKIRRPAGSAVRDRGERFSARWTPGARGRSWPWLAKGDEPITQGR
jgi:hypothetical protein